MTAQTPKAARAELAARVTAAALPGVNVVLDHEPTAVVHGVAVTFSTAGIDPTEWLISARVYVSTAMGAEAAQDALDDTVLAVDPLLYEVPRTRWEFDGPDEDLEAYVATMVLSYPREDF